MPAIKLNDNFFMNYEIMEYVCRNMEESLDRIFDDMIYEDLPEYIRSEIEGNVLSYIIIKKTFLELQNLKK